MFSLAELPPFAIGTWQVDSAHWPEVCRTELMRLYHEAIDTGYGFFDTAEVYANGASEMLLARCMRGCRDRVWIADKVFATHLRPVSVIKSCEKSLRRLQTDYIDLYQIHWPAGSFGTPDIPIQDTLGACAELQRQGKIRYIGVCNFNAEQLQRACACVDIATLQSAHSLLWPSIGADLQDQAKQSGLSLLAYSPLAQGLLAGKKRSDLSLSDHRRKNILYQEPMYEACVSLTAQLNVIAQTLQMPLIQLALWWLSAQAMIPIIGIRTLAQFRQHCSWLPGQLTAATMLDIQTVCDHYWQMHDFSQLMWRS